ncbi:DUF4232 domain-containing protein [Catellatospora vulcania]|uniref:DUF4232 domain-containing protein n=1 Tax=Catellatospora vulcania TaxID=1460450 RepID=UPI0018AF90E7|nr:DUF4232 domain-containing protein [Catellatospora vulcania]
MPDNTPPEQPPATTKVEQVTAAEIRARIKALGQEHQYHAFISYARDPDLGVARALRGALHGTGTRWWQRGRLRVFLDSENIATGADLPGRLRNALDGSARMILLASEESVRRPYVQQEIAHLLKTRSEHILIVYTGGKASGTQAIATLVEHLPEELRGKFSRQRLWEELPAKARRPLRGRAEIRHIAAKIAAGILDLDPAALGRVEARRHRWRMATVAAGFVLALVAGTILWRVYTDYLLEQEKAAAQLLSTAAHAARADGDPTSAAQFDAAAWLTHADPTIETDLINDQNTALQTLIPATGGAFSPDGQLLTVTGLTHKPRIWNAAGSIPAADLATDIDLPRFVSGTRILLGRDRANAGTILRWDLADPQHPKDLPPIDTGYGKVTAMTADPSGKTLAVGGDKGQLRLWSLDTVTPLADAVQAPRSDAAVVALAFSDDGRRLAAGSVSGSVDLWRLEGSQPVHDSRPVPVGGSSDSRFAFGPDADSVIILDGHSNAFRWVLRNDPDLIQYAGSQHLNLGGAYTAALSPDGATMATMANNGTLQLWNMTVPTDPLPLGPPLKPIPARFVEEAAFPDRATLTFSPDGRTLLADIGSQPALLWHLPTTYFPGAGLISSVKSAGIGDYVVSVHDGTMTGVWTMTTPPKTTTLRSDTGGAGTAVATSADGKVIAAGHDGLAPTVQIRYGDGYTKTATVTLPGGTQIPVTALALNSDGTTLAAATAANPAAVYLIDLNAPAATLKPAPLKFKSTANVTAMKFTPDGRRLAISGSELEIRDLAGGSTILTGGGGASSLAFTADGAGLAASSGGTSVSLWNVDSPEPVATLPETPAINGPPTAPAAFSPDGRTLATGANDGFVRLWNVTDRSQPTLIGNPLVSSVSVTDRYLTSRRYTAGVQAVGWSADGRMLAAANVDGTVRMWDMDPRRVIDRICEATGANLTEQIWERYVPTLDYDPPCTRPAGAAAPAEVPAENLASVGPGGDGGACKAEQLKFGYGKRTESQWGHQFTVALEITNTSDGACGLFGDPDVTLNGPDHRQYGPVYRPRGDSHGANEVMLAAGARARVDLTYLVADVGEDGAWQPDKVKLTLPGGGGILELPWPAGTPVVRQDAASTPGTFVGTFLLDS